MKRTKPQRFIVGDQKAAPRTRHRDLGAVVQRVNALVDLGYRQIPVADADTGFSCVVNGYVNTPLLRRVLRTVDLDTLEYLIKLEEKRNA